MKRGFAALAIIVLLAWAIALAGGIRDGSLSAYSNGTNIVVRWASDDETGVTGYTIERKAGGSSTFVRLTDPALAPKGSGSAYEFVDNTAFRTLDNFYQYRITALGVNAVYYVSVNHSVSSVRRTWGSIKAMFR
jgi:hypothetical protein